MMKQKNQIKRQPTYDLQECKDATNTGRIQIPERVRRHINDINTHVEYLYNTDTLINFINNLTEADFSKSILYPNNDVWFDIYINKHDFFYINKYQEEEKITLTLYFKYFIEDEELFVQVVSFHPER